MDTSLSGKFGAVFCILAPAVNAEIMYYEIQLKLMLKLCVLWHKENVKEYIEICLVHSA